MNADDWKQLQKIVEAPDPKLLQKILAASSHESAHARAQGWSRSVVRAVRRLAADLRGAAMTTAEVERDEALQETARTQQMVQQLTAENEEFRGLLEIASA